VLPEALRPAREMLNGADSDEVNAAVRAVLGPDRAEELAAELGEASFRGAAVIALDQLIDGAYQDADDVRTQRAAVASGETPESETRRRKKCLAALAKLVLAGAVVGGTHGIALAGGIGGVAYAAWEAWTEGRCQEIFRELVGGRFD
jgi:hypothetical protein